ncbi:MAG TPA: glycosyltransferase family A protein, partial [Clostridia bacterium]|nr:glycosyltransferase family A protein [Clostridia bacterium]
MLFLSIITPTYNRANLLSACYASLCQQTDLDFEWIVVDDGSTDDTEAVVRSFQTESFPVFYRKKNNGGKHTALNAAHDLIHGKYVLLLDSDDTLTPDAVASIKMEWGKWENDEAVGIVTFLRGSTVNDPKCIVHDWGKPVDIMRYRRTCIHSNDCCEVIRTELFKKYPFPVFEDERFLAEGALWG